MKMKESNPQSAQPVRGRPVKNEVEPIKDTPIRVAVAIMRAPPKAQWDYLKKKD